MRKRRWLTIVVAGILAFCILGWALAYYFVGVDVSFIAGMVRARVADGGQAMPAAPAGVEVTTVVDGLDAPTSLAWSPDGALYVAEYAGGAGRITALTQPGRRVTVAEGIPAPLGIAFHDGFLYVCPPRPPRRRPAPPTGSNRSSTACPRCATRPTASPLEWMGAWLSGREAGATAVRWSGSIRSRRASSSPMRMDRICACTRPGCAIRTTWRFTRRRVSCSRPTMGVTFRRKA